MTKDINININSILGSIAVIAFVVLLFGTWYKPHNPNSEIPDNIFIGSAIILGFAISIGIYANTDLGLPLSFTIGYIPAFIILSFITSIGLELLLLDLLALLLVVMIAYYLKEYLR